MAYKKHGGSLKDLERFGGGTNASDVENVNALRNMGQFLSMSMNTGDSKIGLNYNSKGVATGWNVDGKRSVDFSTENNYNFKAAALTPNNLYNNKIQTAVARGSENVAQFIEDTAASLIKHGKGPK